MSQSTYAFVEDVDSTFQAFQNSWDFDGSPLTFLSNALTEGPRNWGACAIPVMSLATTGMTPQAQAPHHEFYGALTPPYDSPNPLVPADPPTALSLRPNTSTPSYSYVPPSSVTVQTPFQAEQSPITPPWSEVSLSPPAPSPHPPAVSEELTNFDFEYYSGLFHAPVAPRLESSAVECDPNIFAELQYTLAAHHAEHRKTETNGYQAEQIQAYSFAAGSTGAVFGQPYSMSETNPHVSHSSLRNHTEQTTSDGTTAHGTRELQYALAPTDTYSFYQNFTPIHYGQDVVQVPLLEGAAQEPIWYFQGLPGGSVYHTQGVSPSRAPKAQSPNSKPPAPLKKKAPRPKAARNLKSTIVPRVAKSLPHARGDRAKRDHIACLECRHAKQRCERENKDEKCKRCEGKKMGCNTPDDAKPRGHPRKDGSKAKEVVNYDQTIVMGDDFVGGESC